LTKHWKYFINPKDMLPYLIKGGSSNRIKTKNPV
jgi:hypothetical protein